MLNKNGVQHGFADKFHSNRPKILDMDMDMKVDLFQSIRCYPIANLFSYVEKKLPT